MTVALQFKVALLNTALKHRYGGCFLLSLVAVSSLERHCVNQGKARKPWRFTKALQFYKSKQKLCIASHKHTLQRQKKKKKDLW